MTCLSNISYYYCIAIRHLRLRWRYEIKPQGEKVRSSWGVGQGVEILAAPRWGLVRCRGAFLQAAG
jgi:hypothetical protein